MTTISHSRIRCSTCSSDHGHVGPVHPGFVRDDLDEVAPITIGEPGLVGSIECWRLSGGRWLVVAPGVDFVSPPAVIGTMDYPPMMSGDNVRAYCHDGRLHYVVDIPMILEPRGGHREAHVRGDSGRGYYVRVASQPIDGQ